MSVDLTQYPSAPAHGFAGQLAHPIENTRVNSGVALEELGFGVPALIDIDNGTSQGVRPVFEPDAADADGIVTSHATVAAATTLSGADLNGAIGADPIFPPRNVVIVATSHADFDLTTWYVRGLDADGDPQEEAFVMPNGGNTTLTGNKFFSAITEVYQPAQSGTGGAFTVGTGSKLGPIDAGLKGVTLYDATKAPGAYAVNAPVPVCEEGGIYVYSETAVDPTKPVYVRLVISGNEVRGRFRATADANDCAQVKRGRWIEKTSGAGIAGLRLLP